MAPEVVGGSAASSNAQETREQTEFSTPWIVTAQKNQRSILNGEGRLDVTNAYMHFFSPWPSTEPLGASLSPWRSAPGYYWTRLMSEDQILSHAVTRHPLSRLYEDLQDDRGRQTRDEKWTVRSVLNRGFRAYNGVALKAGLSSKSTTLKWRDDSTSPDAVLIGPTHVLVGWDEHTMEPAFLAMKGRGNEVKVYDPSSTFLSRQRLRRSRFKDWSLLDYRNHQVNHDSVRLHVKLLVGGNLAFTQWIVAGATRPDDPRFRITRRRLEEELKHSNIGDVDALAKAYRDSICSLRDGTPTVAVAFQEVPLSKLLLKNFKLTYWALPNVLANNLLDLDISHYKAAFPLLNGLEADDGMRKVFDKLTAAYPEDVFNINVVATAIMVWTDLRQLKEHADEPEVSLDVFVVYFGHYLRYAMEHGFSVFPDPFKAISGMLTEDRRRMPETRLSADALEESDVECAVSGITSRLNGLDPGFRLIVTPLLLLLPEMASSGSSETGRETSINVMRGLLGLSGRECYGIPAIAKREILSHVMLAIPRLTFNKLIVSSARPVEPATLPNSTLVQITANTKMHGIAWKTPFDLLVRQAPPQPHVQTGNTARRDSGKRKRVLSPDQESSQPTKIPRRSDSPESGRAAIDLSRRRIPAQETTHSLVSFLTANTTRDIGPEPSSFYRCIGSTYRKELQEDNQMLSRFIAQHGLPPETWDLYRVDEEGMKLSDVVSVVQLANASDDEKQGYAELVKAKLASKSPSADGGSL